MERKNKPSFEKLADWIEGRLSSQEAEAIATQVAADETLQADVAWLRTFHQNRQQTVFAAPPANLRSELNRQFAAYAAANRPTTLWERITAVLKFDSQTQPTAVGVRSSSATERQLVYTTSHADVALTIQLQTLDKTFQLFGQVLPTHTDTLDTFSVQLFQYNQERIFTTTDEGGEFVLEEMPGGHYDLAIGNDQYQILIPLQLAL